LQFVSVRRLKDLRRLDVGLGEERSSWRWWSDLKDVRIWALYTLRLVKDGFIQVLLIGTGRTYSAPLLRREYEQCLLGQTSKVI